MVKLYYEMVLKLDPGSSEAQNEIQKLQQVLESSGRTAEKSESDAEPLQQQQRKQEAVVQKDRGNAYFKEGEYEAAVECYSRGMQADGTNALLPANKAMAYLRLHRFSEAEQDCSAALALDASYAKAFARRATARAARGRIREAKEDFKQVLKLEPGNKQALSEIEKLSAEMRSSGLLAPEDNKQRRSIQSINKPEDLRSTKPLRRIDIQEVGAEISPSTSSPHPKIQKIEEISDAPVSRACVDSSADPESIPPPPSNAFQLEADLRKTSRHPQSTYKYLKQISPDAYLKIFQNSLEPDVLNHILKTFHSFFQHDDASLLLAVLRSLASVRRFDMTVMFMSSAEKKLLQELFDWIHSAGLGDASVQDLQKKYGL
ncbi:RNA polymerase II-associated protein 3-like [Sinocyclocheilus anshuiensis]|uniref:RNA polymerase II-associated protein 3-like n=1 Tax=Sinocyclocheilus anshuiensis TaxID=1608454 RepID=UPI0007BA79F4|nr:PREDICTED: RNA polymerase II-associated protein 3-like [Sinocyclocheilus anshuiensis]